MTRFGLRRAMLVSEFVECNQTRLRQICFCATCGKHPKQFFPRTNDIFAEGSRLA